MSPHAPGHDIGSEAVEDAHEEQVGCAALGPTQQSVKEAVEQSLGAVSCEPGRIADGGVVAWIVKKRFKSKCSLSHPDEEPVVSEAVWMHPIANKA